MLGARHQTGPHDPAKGVHHPCKHIKCRFSAKSSVKVNCRPQVGCASRAYKVTWCLFENVTTAEHSLTSCRLFLCRAAQVDPKRVYVGGMPFTTTEDDIHQYFGECGTIADLDFCTFPDTGKFNGICFITFKVRLLTILSKLHTV